MLQKHIFYLEYNMIYFWKLLFWFILFESKYEIQSNIAVSENAED